jgi:hypothetical protein
MISYLSGFVAINLIDTIKHNPPLPDVFFSIIPQIPDYYPSFLLIIYYCYFLIRIIQFDHKRYFIRLLKYLSILLTMRIITFSVTTVPPALKGCFGRNPGEPIIWNVIPILLSKNDNTCIDYMFSGHTTYFLLLLLFMYEISDSIKEKILNTIYVIIGIITIIAGRIHYSADVAVAIFMTTLCYSST